MKVFVKCDGPCAMMAQLEAGQEFPLHWRRVQTLGEGFEVGDFLYCPDCFPALLQAAPPKPIKKPKGSAANKGQS